MDHKKFEKDLQYYIDDEGKQRVERETPICDFCCGDPEEFPIKWSYPTGEMPIDLSGPICASDDNWGACDECHKLIKHMTETWSDRTPLMARIIRVQFERFSPNGMKDFVEMEMLDQVKFISDLNNLLHQWHKARLGPPFPEGEFDPKTGEML